MKKIIIAFILAFVLSAPLTNAASLGEMQSQLDTLLRQVINLLLEQVRVLKIQVAQLEANQNSLATQIQNLPGASDNVAQLSFGSPAILTTSSPSVIPMGSTPTINPDIQQVLPTIPDPVIPPSYYPEIVFNYSSASSTLSWTANIQSGENLTCTGKNLLMGQNMSSGSIVVSNPQPGSVYTLQCEARPSGNLKIENYTISAK